MEGNNQQVQGSKPGLGIVKSIILSLIFLAIGAGSIYLLAKQKPSLIGLPKTGVEARKEVDALVIAVGKLIALPTDEVPTVATVTDTEGIKDQPFFVNAKVGDKVLIYANAKKSILYRPSENKIIEVGAVNVSQTQQTPEASASPRVGPTPKATLAPTLSPSATPTGTTTP